MLSMSRRLHQLPFAVFLQLRKEHGLVNRWERVPASRRKLEEYGETTKKSMAEAMKNPKHVLFYKYMSERLLPKCREPVPAPVQREQNLTNIQVAKDLIDSSKVHGVGLDIGTYCLLARTLVLEVDLIEENVPLISDLVKAARAAYSRSNILKEGSLSNLLTALGAIGRAAEAEAVLRETIGFVDNLRARHFGAVIRGYLYTGDVERAIAIYRWAREENKQRSSGRYMTPYHCLDVVSYAFFTHAQIGEADGVQQSSMAVLREFLLNEWMDDVEAAEELLGPATCKAVQDFFLHDSSGVKWRTSIAELSISGVCRSCSYQLDTIKFDWAERERLVETFKRALGLRYKHDLALLVKVLSSDFGDCDIIVDGQNIGHAGNFRHWLTDFEGTVLERVLQALLQQGWKPLVVIPQHKFFEGRKASQLAMARIRNLVPMCVIPHHFKYKMWLDDMLCLCLSLQRNAMMLTMDKMRDKYLPVPYILRGQFKRYIKTHSVVCEFVKKDGGAVEFELPVKVLHKVHRDINGYHLPLYTKEFLCVRRVTTETDSNPGESVSGPIPTST